MNSRIQCVLHCQLEAFPLPPHIPSPECRRFLIAQHLTISEALPRDMVALATLKTENYFSMSSTASSRVPDPTAPRAASGPKLAAWSSPAPESTAAANRPSAQPPSADTQAVDEARREIHTLTREIAELVSSNLAPAEFLAA